MSNTFGRLFRVTTFGESHSKSVGAVIDGFPANIELTEADIQPQLNRRKPGQSSITTARNEADEVEIVCGTENGITLGTPICLILHNKDQRPADYKEIENIPRPSHADYTYFMKYGIKSASGGGRDSARETAARVAAGAIAEKYLLKKNIEIVAWVSSVGEIDSESVDKICITRRDVDKNPVRCLDQENAVLMLEEIKKVRNEGDSIGGIISCVCRNVPIGLGEPVFGKMEAELARGMLSIPAVKGFEVGAGFSAARMKGSAHNDMFIKKGSCLGTKTNRNGGIQGGISNGETVTFRVAFKPTPTISKPQITANFKGNEVLLKAKGRHDPCIVTRAVPVVESMAALVIADLMLLS